jgi:hypothetical protein
MPGILKVDSIQLASGSSVMTLNNMQPGFILSSTAIRNGTRSAVSNSAYTVLFSGSFTKLRADSTLIATCTVYGDGYNSGNCGVGMQIDSSSNWDYGCHYQYDGSWSSTQQTTIVSGQCQWTGISAGSHTIGFGWKCANGSTGEAPFKNFNPNTANGETRNQQMVSSIFVYEIAT